ncbi:MAG: MBL fold metallo-hydrolase [Lachnospiraceae bacterium]|nr:MBL fold metallo-hydrolase [Lachnospiraceae bacterium]
MLKVSILVVGPVITNCYIVSDESEAVIIDPGENAKGIIAKLQQLGTEPAAILLTHGHFDHITAVPALKAAYPDLPVYAYREERALLENAVLNESGSMGTGGIVLQDVHYLEDGEELQLLGETWKVIATPGHTIGSCCYYLPSSSALFSGDTLFAGDCGRTDLATGSMPSILHSIREVLMKLPDDTTVLPGHEEMTSIGVERKRNIVMRMR